MSLLKSSLSSVNSIQRTAGLSGLLSSIVYPKAKTTPGLEVNPTTSMKISGFFCGVKNITDAIAMLPFRVYQKEGKSKELQDSHNIDEIIYSAPNRKMVAFQFWKAMATAIIIKGNAYAQIIRDGAGRVRELNFIHPEDVQVYEYEGELYYKVKGQRSMLFDYEIFHVPGFSWNGITGIGVIKYAADNLGLSLAADEFGTESFANKGVTYGAVETDKSLNDIGKRNIRSLVAGDLQADTLHRVAVLDEGMKYKPIGITPQEAQFIESKAQGVEDIARWLNIPLHKLHAKGEGGYNFLVQMDIEYMKSTIMPLVVPILQEIMKKLMDPQERSLGYYVHADYNYLLKADPKSRAQYYKDLVMVKAMSPNEVRELEEMNPYEGGDEYLQMVNMITDEQYKKKLENESNTAQ